MYTNPPRWISPNSVYCGRTLSQHKPWVMHWNRTVDAQTSTTNMPNAQKTILLRTRPMTVEAFKSAAERLRAHDAPGLTLVVEPEAIAELRADARVRGLEALISPHAFARWLDEPSVPFGGVILLVLDGVEGEPAATPGACDRAERLALAWGLRLPDTDDIAEWSWLRDAVNREANRRSVEPLRRELLAFIEGHLEGRPEPGEPPPPSALYAAVARAVVDGLLTDPIDPAAADRIGEAVSGRVLRSGLAPMAQAVVVRVPGDVDPDLRERIEDAAGCKTVWLTGGVVRVDVCEPERPSLPERPGRGEWYRDVERQRDVFVPHEPEVSGG